VSEAECFGGASISQSKWSLVKMHFGVLPALSTVDMLKSQRLLEES
jgi:hypothetical protein